MAENNTENPQQQLTPEEAAKERKNTIFNWLIAIVAIVVLTMKYPLMMQGALIFIITLSILVFVHEWGHYQFGRWAGMKVNRFGIGFPPWIYTKRHNGIDYSVGALPIGGMVDIAGLGSEEEMVATAKQDGEVVNNSQRAARPDTPHGQKLFQDASLGWRFMTLFAGPLMNFLFAIFIFITCFSIWGAVDRIDTAQTIGFVRPNTPADQAGLRIGDKIVSINGQTLPNGSAIAQKVYDSGRQLQQTATTVQAGGVSAGIDTRVELGNRSIEPLIFGIERHGQALTKTITPKMDEVPVLEAGGRVGSRPSPLIGIEFDEIITRKQVSVGEAVNQGVTLSLNMTGQILSFLGRAVTANLSSEEVKSIGGPVKIAQATTKSARGGFYAACLTAALISVNLGLMNLLPLPALDGGRILFLGYELIFRKPLDSKKESLFHMAGMALLLLFMVGITIKDVWPWVIRSFNNVF
jgi:regulator of sigma E protease